MGIPGGHSASLPTNSLVRCLIHTREKAPAIHLGVSLRPSYTTWPALREWGRRVEALGYDSLWTSDHFIGDERDLEAPYFEGWQLLPAWGALTERIRIGMLVSGNTYRNPAILAKMAATLDHVTGGRAILGLGAAWYEREHRAYGVPFDTKAVRLARLNEAVAIIRSLLTQRRTTFPGRYYQLADAPFAPRPIQAHLPLMIGGGGERKTLRIAAQYADLWNGFGTPETIAHKLAVLREHCAAVGRDPAAILPTVSLGLVIRDDPAAVQERVREIDEVNHGDGVWLGPSGSVEEVAQGLAAYCSVGVRGFIVDMPSPFDEETLTRLATEVRPRLN
jgi:F420-dependent oxidoreductase-like protein